MQIMRKNKKHAHPEKPKAERLVIYLGKYEIRNQRVDMI